MENKQTPTPRAAQPAGTQPTQTKVRAPRNKTAKGKLVKKIAIFAIAGIVAIGAGLYFMRGKVFSGNTTYDHAVKNIAEVHNYKKVAEAGNLNVEFYTGMREEPYGQNGVAGKTTPFAMINLLSKEAIAATQIEGVIKIANEQYNFTLLQNRYSPMNYAYDIVGNLRKAVTASDEVEVTLFITDKNHPSVTLRDAFDGNAIKWDGALKVASELYTEKLKGKKFETYVTIQDVKVANGGAYWLVQFVTEDGTRHSCVVAPDGSVISK